MRLDDHEAVLLGGGVFGFGLGAVLDVAVFHLVLQWHHLMSARIDPTTLAGIALAWRGVNRASATQPTVRLVGAVVAGTGVFNLFDGVVDHYLLHLHDVVHRSPVLNPHWVGASLLLLGTGTLVATRDRRP